MADIPLDFGTLEAEGCFTGSGAVVVLSDKDDMKAVALNLLRFFEDESCGQCTPCRVGTEKAVKLMSEPHWDEALLQELARVMGDASICGLGQAAMNPVKQVLKHFREDLQYDAFRPPRSSSRRKPGSQWHRAVRAVCRTWVPALPRGMTIHADDRTSR